ncbi:MAG: ABC transporter ATP-binding protein [Paracoccaceae bacterium]|nr:ABC transporter ATP-binding protein [Paracoccaceae bacterium]
MSEPILRLQGIDKMYNRGLKTQISVLAELDLQIAPGHVVALVAPSGAGKSTLLHIAGLLDTADVGRVEIAGLDMRGLSDKKRTAVRRQDIGFIYQFHHLLPEFSALENIVIPQLANNVPVSRARARALELLETVGIETRAHHRPSALSGGEQQRVAFCRAIANQPKILLADEPTGNLDPTTSDTVFNTLLQLVRETGLSALIATHNLDLADRMDQMLRLENGQISVLKRT